MNKQELSTQGTVQAECNICWKPATKTVTVDIDIKPIYLCADEDCKMKLFILLNQRK